MKNTSASANGVPPFLAAEYHFAAHIRDPLNVPCPKDVDDRRMAIYRELLYNNIENFLENGFPVLRRITDDKSWHKMVRDFFAVHRSLTPLFMEIPREFIVYLEKERNGHDEDFPFLWELAHYEWAELALSVAEDPKPDSGINPDGDLLEQWPAISCLVWPLSYQFPVHRISPDFLPDSPGKEETQLLVYRDQEDEVGFIELNPVSARLLGLLLENPETTGISALHQIAEELQHPEPATVVQGGLDILQQWKELNIVLGARTPS